MIAASANPDTTLAFIELGAVALTLAVLARVASRLGITAIPLYLLAGLAVGEGGIAPLDVSEEFIGLVAEIGVLLLLLTLGLEYNAPELRNGMRAGLVPGLVDGAVNFVPGLAAGLLLGWEKEAAILLGGVCWVSSSGIVAKILSDLDRLSYRETPVILNLLVVEDLAMAVFLPIVGALVTGQELTATTLTVAVAVAVILLILTIALRYGARLSQSLESASDESLLLGVFGLMLLVGGLAQQLEVSAAIGAFVVGLALSGPVQRRSGELVGPLRDLFAAVFFLFFSFQIDPADLIGALGPAVALAIVGTGGKMLSGWIAGARSGIGTAGRFRAGASLVARGEFSIVIASIGASLAHGAELGATAAAFVLLTALAGPILARFIGSPRRVNPAVPEPPRLT